MAMTTSSSMSVNPDVLRKTVRVANSGRNGVGSLHTVPARLMLGESMSMSLVLVLVYVGMGPIRRLLPGSG